VKHPPLHAGLGPEDLDDILVRLGFEDVVKARRLDPLKPRHFLLIVERVAKALRNVTQSSESEAVAGALNALDVDWANVSASKINEVIGAAQNQLSAVAQQVMPRVTEVFESRAGALVKDTKVSAIQRFSLDIGADLSATDERIAEFARDTSSLFVRDAYGLRAEEFSVRARGLVAEGLESGLGRDAIAASIESTVTEGALARGMNYWRNISSIFTSRARNNTQIAALEEAAVETYRWESVMDGATSSICRMLHGTEWSVSRAAEHMRSGFALDDPEDIVDHSPFVQEGSDDGQAVLYFNRKGERHVVADILDSGVGERDKVGTYKPRMTQEELLAAGVQFPPAHGNCRSTVTAVA